MWLSSGAGLRRDVVCTGSLLQPVVTTSHSTIRLSITPRRLAWVTYTIMSKGTPIKDPFDPARSTVPAKIRARNQLIRDAEALYGHEPDEADREILNTE
mgnify:CR=1 FL=1|jgi:hypothetical protein